MRLRELPLFRWFALSLGAAFACAALSSCNTTKATPAAPSAPLVARFFLEAKRNEAGVPVTLPRSGLTITVAPRPVLVEYDIVNAELVQVELGRCLLVQLTPAASRDLYRLSVSSVGRRLVISLNDEFLGARQIEGAMADGTVMIFLEVSDDALPEIVTRLKQTSAELTELARRARKS